MNLIHKEILTAIDERIKHWISTLQFDRTYYGKVVEIVDNRIARVDINGAIVDCRIKYAISFAVDDVVIIKAPNNNFSYLYIDGKLTK